MLEKPDIQNEIITVCLQAEYGLRVVQIEFLPLGADHNTAVYRVIADNGTPFFLKLRSGVFDDLSVELPRFLSEQGIEQIIAPETTLSGHLLVRLDGFTLILYPFIEGGDAYQVDLTNHHWLVFGSALKRIHTVSLPKALETRIQKEQYSSYWRMAVISFLNTFDQKSSGDSVAIQVAELLKTKRVEILDLIDRAERYAGILQSRPQNPVLCHSDLHAGNVFIGDNGELYFVDWDNPILAPKERDLMFPGGGQGFTGHMRQEEETLFYRGYGQTLIDPVALSYYRFERIIQDIAAYCEQLLLSNEGGQDREQSLRYLMSNFLPDNTIEIAYRTDKTGL